MARTPRRGRVPAVVAVAMLLAGCGAGSTSAGSPSTTGRPTTTDRSTTTVPAPTGPAPGPGLYGSELPPCDPAVGSHTTVSDWLTGPLPAGTSVSAARTDVAVDAADGTPIPTTWVLARIESDRMVSTIRLTRGTTPLGQPGFSVDDGAPRVDSVRGRPGRIATWINRGDPTGQQVAEWSEDGVAWRAASPLGADALGAALAPLTIRGGRVEDPTGRFRVIGSGPEYQTGRRRVTNLVIDETAGAGEHARTSYVRVDDPAPGSTGITRAPIGPDGTVRTVDGRLLLTAGSSAASTLADGSLVTISTYDRTSNPVHADPEVVSRIVSALRRRTPGDDQFLRTVPLLPSSAGADPTTGYCIEP